MRAHGTERKKTGSTLFSPAALRRIPLAPLSDATWAPSPLPGRRCRSPLASLLRCGRRPTTSLRPRSLLLGGLLPVGTSLLPVLAFRHIPAEPARPTAGPSRC